MAKTTRIKVLFNGQIWSCVKYLGVLQSGRLPYSAGQSSVKGKISGSPEDLLVINKLWNFWVASERPFYSVLYDVYWNGQK